MGPFLAFFVGEDEIRSFLLALLADNAVLKPPVFEAAEVVEYAPIADPALAPLFLADIPAESFSGEDLLFFFGESFIYYLYGTAWLTTFCCYFDDWTTKAFYYGFYSICNLFAG